MLVPDYNRIFKLATEEEFRSLAMDVFRYQAVANPVYREYLALLKKDPEKIEQPEQIPFLPIGFFKTHRIITGEMQAELVFESSRTTGETPSRHFVANAALYQESLANGFKRIYGDPEDWCILSLLPSYVERGNSSLVYMMDRLMKQSGHPDSGFYLNEAESLHRILEKRAEDAHPTMLVGVSFALLDLASDFRGMIHPDTVIMETGGMKGRRKEMIRSELHQVLKEAFRCGEIHSEYGMTELLSQAFSTGYQLFETPPWMRILIRDSYDPFTLVPAGQTGGINVIDLANIHSCSFISTSDLGRVNDKGQFEVLGRFDQAEVRGCNLMVS